MDSPRNPEASSPVVLLPSNPYTAYTRAMNEVTAISGRRRTQATRTDEVTAIAGRRRTQATRTVRITRPSSNQYAAYARTMTEATSRRSATARSRQLELANLNLLARARTNNAPAAGPTTRSRKRSHSSMGDQTTTRIVTAVRPSTAASSRKRRAPPSSTERRSMSPRTTRNRKKPPPGADLKKAPPQAGTSDKDDDKKPAPKVDCCICMEPVEPKDLAKIDGCNHRFCFGCIEKWSERENKCPLCKARFTKIERVHKKYQKGSKNTKKVKQKDQRSDISPGTVEGLIGKFLLFSLRFPEKKQHASHFDFSFIFSPANLHRNSGIFAPANFRNSGGLARLIFRNIDAEFEDSDDDSDEDTPMARFMRALHRVPDATEIGVSTTVVRPVSVMAHFSTTTRSFARNVHDSTAGNGADNPLEIDDDSVEEVIEID